MTRRDYTALTVQRAERENRGVPRWFFAIGLLVWVVACHRGGDSTPCGAVAAKFLESANHDLGTAKVDDATLHDVNDQLPAMRDALGEACTDGKWSESVKKCLVQANDHVAFTACEAQLTDEQRTKLDRAARGLPTE